MSITAKRLMELPLDARKEILRLGAELFMKSEGGGMTNKIEIVFPVPVEFPDGFERRLNELIDTVCKKYEAEHPDRAMWPSGFGFRPNWSKADASFLGMAADENAPESGETTFDETVYHVGVAEREKYDAD